MVTRHYDWGVNNSGTDDSGATTIPLEASYGPPAEIDGTLGALITVIIFSSNTKFITIRNTHDSDSLEYSYDGLTWLGIGPYGEISEPINIASVALRRVSGSPTYEVIAALVS